MTDLLALTILTALFTSSVLFCLTKWGLLTTYQVYRRSWMPRGDCYYCLSFWFGVPAFALYGAIVFSDTWYGFLMLPVMLACNLGSAALSAFVCSVIIGTSEG